MHNRSDWTFLLCPARLPPFSLFLLLHSFPSFPCLAVRGSALIPICCCHSIVTPNSQSFIGVKLVSLRDFYHHKPNTAGWGSEAALMERSVWRFAAWTPQRILHVNQYAVYYFPAMRMAIEWHSVANERSASKSFSYVKYAVSAKRRKWYSNKGRHTSWLVMCVPCHTRVASSERITPDMLWKYVHGFMIQVILVFFEGAWREITVTLRFLTIIVILIKTNGQRWYQCTNSFEGAMWNDRQSVRLAQSGRHSTKSNSVKLSEKQGFTVGGAGGTTDLWGPLKLHTYIELYLC